MSLIRMDVDLKRWRFGASIGFHYGVKFKDISIKTHGEWRGGFRIHFLCFWFYCDRHGIDPSIDHLAMFLPTTPAKMIIKSLTPMVCEFINPKKGGANG